jgi:hypothetical protein
MIEALDLQKKLVQLWSRIEGVDHIFLDEVSMLSCHDMFKISFQLAKGTNEYEDPFGGINMIFAGDFAQLPPVKGAALYSGSIGTQLWSRMTTKKQEETIGKAFMASNHNSCYLTRKHETKDTIPRKQ